jgi:hypothetical protein
VTVVSPELSALWQVQCGLPFDATLVAGPGMTPGEGWPTFGARIERPVTRAIVSPFQTAALDGGLWVATLDAPLDEGSYLLVWMTTEDPPSFEAFVPLFATNDVDLTASPIIDFPSADIAACTPSVADVSALERTRTLDINDVDQQVFNDKTRPTAVEVETLIKLGVNYVLSQLREEFDPVHYPQVKFLVSLYVATMIEESYYREQAAGHTELYVVQFTNGLTELSKRVEEDMIQANLLGGMEPWHPLHRMERWQML